MLRHGSLKEKVLFVPLSDGVWESPAYKRDTPSFFVDIAGMNLGVHLAIRHSIVAAQ